jgi:hypothetical protein
MLSIRPWALLQIKVFACVLPSQMPHLHTVAAVTAVFAFTRRPGVPVRAAGCGDLCLWDGDVEVLRATTLAANAPGTGSSKEPPAPVWTVIFRFPTGAVKLPPEVVSPTPPRAFTLGFVVGATMLLTAPGCSCLGELLRVVAFAGGGMEMGTVGAGARMGGANEPTFNCRGVSAGGGCARGCAACARLLLGALPTPETCVAPTGRAG